MRGMQETHVRRLGCRTAGLIAASAEPLLAACRFVDGGGGASKSPFFADPTFDFGVQQLLSQNVYIVIGTADHPDGELQGHAELGWVAQSS